MPSKHSSLTLFLLPLSYLLTAIFFAALLAYPIYTLLDLNISFPRLVNRLGLGFLMLAIIPMAGRINLSLQEMGFAPDFSTILRQFSRGFLLGFLILGVITLVLLWLDIRIIRESEIARDRLLYNLSSAIATGLIVSILEETLFRGLLFRALFRWGDLRSAVLITAFFYAGLHFVGGRGSGPAEEICWTTGLQLVPVALLQIFDPSNLDSFLALFAVSVFLTTVLIERPNGIGYCIGLHAAWVFILKLTKRYTEVTADSPLGFLVGSHDGVTGILVFAWLSVLTLIYWLQIRRKQGQQL
jgi:membrane protease YdiL (CAAX protease family)